MMLQEIEKLEDLKIGMKFMAEDQNCVEFAGADSEDTDGNQLAMFELFCSGRIIVCKVENTMALMDNAKFKRITEEEWMKRVVSVAKFNENRKIYENYLDVYNSLDMDEKEIETAYEKMLSGE